MTDREKAIRILEGNYKSFVLRHNGELLTVNELIALLKAQEPRVMTLDELITGAGVGYEENWLKGEDGEEDSFVLDECAWCKGGVVVNDSEIVSRAALERLYNRPYGLRVWSRKPSAEQREKTPWAG